MLRVVSQMPLILWLLSRGSDVVRLWAVKWGGHRRFKRRM